MEKYFCDHCGKEIAKNELNRVGMNKANQPIVESEIYHLCNKCREEFFGWINGHPSEQAQSQKKEASHFKAGFPVWTTVKQLAARFCRNERRMNAAMKEMKVERRMAKEGHNWWYEYRLTKKIYDALCKKYDVTFNS